MKTARIKVSDVHGLSADYAMELHAAGKVDGEYILVPLETALELKRRHNAKPEMRGLGDLVHAVAMPIAKALKLSCIDPKTQRLREESPCAKRRQALNQAVPFISK
jgi:hypothetical protein